ncbi:hypothetical protein [Burkholderia ubonensis]|uniref:hypothetical protein n=1 Tax=Burkholderia ubonensis TaxID=101571 RepID=UPI000AD3C997|nr:hypothetical protein [Burkholderia ubonensis]
MSDLTEALREPAVLPGSPQEVQLRQVIQALNGIGIEAHIVEGATGFLSGVRIVAGALHIAPDCRVSDALHEAGHLACVPKRYRHLANDDLDEMAREMLADVDRLDLHPDSPLYRAVIQCSDPEATAWAWAFGQYLGLAPEDIIEDHQYPDEVTGLGTGAEVRMALSMRMYIGIHGLAHAGFCSTNRFGRLPQYPQLAYWTQEI